MQQNREAELDSRERHKRERVRGENFLKSLYKIDKYVVLLIFGFSVIIFLNT